jgi:hypothetical protein
MLRQGQEMGQMLARKELLSQVGQEKDLIGELARKVMMQLKGRGGR